ncbi:hypothetical protein, partial [Micromonospora chokoriensis]
PALTELVKAQQAQFRSSLASFGARTMQGVALARPGSLYADALDIALEELEHAIGRVDHETKSEVDLLSVWAESLREFSASLRKPIVAWPTVGVAWFVVSYLFVMLKSERPDVADMLEVPYTLLASIIFGALGTAAYNTFKKKQ